MPAAVAGITISGSVKNISDPNALSRATGRISYAAAPAVSETTIQVQADLDNDGVYSSDELFISTADVNGFFSVVIPDVTEVTRLTVTTKAPGYSDFVKTYENVGSDLTVVAAVSEGAFNEIDLAGVAAGPSRAGRKTLLGDEVVTLRLFERDASTGRRGSRVSLGRFGDDLQPGNAPLVEVSFPLRGLKISDDSEKVYANVAYLDTVADPETMPGGFQTEGGDGAPFSMLKTFGASQIELFDENGRKLLDDPLDRSKDDVRIKVAVPPGAYGSLEDEDPATDTVEVPFYYYDDVDRNWKVHTLADGSMWLAHLEDNYGNVLNTDDLAELQTMVDATDGSIVSAYQPGGEGAPLTIYSVGEVNHFSTYNSDKRGRVTGQWYKIIGPDGEEIWVKTRYRKKRGGYGGDSDNGKGKNKNVHAFKPGQVDSVVRKLLGKDPAVRQQYLDWVLRSGNPQLIQAITEGVRRFALDHRAEWQGEDNNLLAGINALFGNKWTTDAVIDTNDLGNGIDCTKTPDLCKGIISRTSEEIKKSSNAKKAVAMLMQIAVDAYNPSNLNLSYAMDKGLDMIDLAVKSGNAGGQLATINSYLQTAKSIKGQIDALKGVASVWPPPAGSADFNTYAGYVSDFRGAMDNMKSVASDLGRGLSREQLARRAAAREARPRSVPATALQIADFENEIVYGYKELGGMLYGSYKFDQAQWGYWENDTFVQTAAPAGLAGGNEVGVLEYFNGSEWVPLPGRSDLGIDANHIPVPNTESFGFGTATNPVSYLGTWTIDSLPSVVFQGRLVNDTTGAALGNADKLTVVVNGKSFTPGSDGFFSGEVAVLSDAITYSVPGTYYRRSEVLGGASHDFGNIPMPDKIIFNDGQQRWDTSSIDTVRGLAVTVDAGAFALSGADLTYEFSLHPYYGGADPLLTQTNTTGVLNLAAFDSIGSYTVVVKITADSTDQYGNPVTTQRNYQLRVVNQAPTVDSITLSDANPTAGDKITVSMTASDPDGAEDIRSRTISAICTAADQGNVYLSARQGEDAQGERAWELDTGTWNVYTQPVDELSCSIQAAVRDQSYGYGTGTQAFTIQQNHVGPEVSYTYLRETYTNTYELTLQPRYVYFKDLNQDITEYTVDCGLGGGVITSSTPIYDVDPTTEAEDACVYPVGAGEASYTFTATATDSRGQTATFTSAVTMYTPLEIDVEWPVGTSLVVTEPSTDEAPTSNDGDFDLVELPAPDAGGDRSFTLGLSAASGNGDGSLASFSYEVTYRPAYSYWSTTLATGNLATTGSGDAAVEIAKPGQYTVSAYARDNAGLYASFWKIFYVTAPFDFRLTANGDNDEDLEDWYLTDTVMFAPSLIDEPDGASWSYQWAVQYDGTDTFEDAGTDATLAFSAGSPMTEGTHAVRLTLTNTADGNQPPVVHELEVTVYDPIIATLGSSYTYYTDPDDGVTQTVSLGDSYTLDVALPDGTTMEQAYWIVTKADGSAAEGSYQTLTSSDPSSRTLIFSEAGTYNVEVTTVDTRGLSTTVSSGTITVREYPPTVDALTASATSVSPGTDVTFSATASDVDGQVVNYLWSVTGEYTNSAGQTVSVNETEVFTAANSADPSQFAYGFANLGSFTVALMVEDDSGRESTSSQVAITVAYKAPVISSLTADKTSGPAPLTVTFSATAADEDGTIVDYSWDAGADGSVEQSGTGSTFQTTFTTFGSQDVELTVTDSQGLTATQTLSVYAFDPNAGIVFQFKELRADGLGPDMSFDSADSHMTEMFGKFAQVGLPSDAIDVPNNNVVAMAPTLDGLVGFNGFYSDGWGSPQVHLAKISSPGTYPVGLQNFTGDTSGVTLAVPGGHTCAMLTYGGWSSVSTITDGSVEVFPEGDYITTGGVVNVLALLGTGDWSECIYSASAFVSGSGTNLTLTGGTGTQNRSLILPTGMSLGYGEFSVNGIDLPISSSLVDALDTDASGNVILPVVSGADYMLELDDTVTAGRGYGVLLPASTLASGGDVTVDGSQFGESFIVLNNLPGAGTIDVMYLGATARASTSQSLDGTESSIAVGTVAEAAEVVVEYRNTGTGETFAGKIPIAQLAGTIDFSTLVSNATVTGPALAVDQTAKTITFSYTSSAEMCLVHLYAGFDDYRSREYYFVTDASTSSLAVSYPIPDMEDPYMEGGTNPGTDAITSANAEVWCMDLAGSYDATLLDLFGDLGFPNWYWDSFHDVELLDEFHKPAQETWQAPQ